MSITAPIRNWWANRMERWLTGRIPKQRAYQLDMSNIFIFPSRFGRWFLMMSGLLFILGTNYRNNMMLLLSFFLVSIFLVTLLSSFANFAKLQIHIGKTKSVFAGEELNIPIWIGDNDNQDFIPNQVEGNIHVSWWQQDTSITLDPNDFTNPVGISLATKERGEIELPRLTFENFYPLGLYRCWTHLNFESKIIVYPTPVSTALRPKNLQGEENSESVPSLIAGSDDFDSLKSYQKGEPMQHVAWKQVAKGGDWLSKTYVEDKGSTVWLDIQQFSDVDYETAISQLTYLVLQLAHQKVEYGLALPTHTIVPGSGDEHMNLCLTQLALLPKHSGEQK
ncbi:MAG: DUF58 domain-containing protein [Alteromonadaceae bacterium]|nr:DUF58 domain-containing protein [Alteromonadaceae bacterium]